MKKVFLILLILLLGGCYDYIEIEDTIIITGMLIDYNDNQYELKVEVLDNNDKTEIKTYDLTGSSIEECIYKLSNFSNKDIFISHLKIIILTENTINNNLDYIDYFLRDTKSKMNFHIYYIDKKYKDEIFNLNNNEYGSSLYLNDLIEYNNKILSSSTPLSFLDLVYKRKEYGIEPIYPNIIIKENKIYLDNIITFKDNKKIVLNETQSIFYNMINNTLEKTILDIPCDNNYFSLIVNNSNSKYKLSNNFFNINTSIKGKIINYNCKYKLDDKNTIEKLNNLTKDYLNKNLNDVTNISKTNNIDFLGIQNYIYKHDYKNYKKYNLNNINININSKVVIDSIGEMNK